MSHAALPDDIETLKRLVIGRDAMIAKLMAEIARLKRWRFGRSAERMDATLQQLQLLLDDLQVPAISEHSENDPIVQEALPLAESTQPSAAPRVTTLRRAPRALPAHLPRETIMHSPASCHCPDCGTVMRKLGEDISEMLDFVPGYFKVLRHIRPKFSCAHCSRIIQLPAPARPIERGLPAPGLLAQVIVAKYGDHCPLYRQHAIYRRSGVDLDRAILADWVGGAARLLEPLVESLGRYVRAGEKLHADDTPVPVLDPGRGKTKTGRLWTYVRDDRPAAGADPPAVWYRYSPDRKAEHPQAHLRGFRGILQADAYSGFAPLYATGAILEASCWAHARRKFYDLFVADRSPIATEALRRIGALYAVEREIRGCPPAQRALARQHRVGPLLDALQEWLSATLQTVSAKSELAGAIRYALTRWTSLTRYRDDGRIEIDNNSAERSIRPLVLGRRNYLFAGSDAGGERAANIYSLIGTALLNGMDPYLYLRHVLERIAEHPINRIDQLLPWNVAATLPEQRRQAA
ncbi:MAG TPA: IS66 family transposase [Casimicrobiaceae bacterium]|nr:IS66 family transposase [Casimicrobiaceae bacterium]